MQRLPVVIYSTFSVCKREKCAVESYFDSTQEKKLKLFSSRPGDRTSIKFDEKEGRKELSVSPSFLFITVYKYSLALSRKRDQNLQIKTTPDGNTQDGTELKHYFRNLTTFFRNLISNEKSKLNGKLPA